MFLHFNTRFGALQVADDSSLVLQWRLPFGRVLMLVAAICNRMNLWEASITIGRHRHRHADDITAGFYATQRLLYCWGQTRPPAPPAAPTGPRGDGAGLYCIDEIDFGAAAQATIDALCAASFNRAWDIGSPQPDSPDILHQVRLVMDDIDQGDGALPY